MSNQKLSKNIHLLNICSVVQQIMMSQRNLIDIMYVIVRQNFKDYLHIFTIFAGNYYVGIAYLFVTCSGNLVIQIDSLFSLHLTCEQVHFDGYLQCCYEEMYHQQMFTIELGS